MKYFGAYGPHELSSSIFLTDVTTLNDIESAHYLVTFAGSIYMEKVKSEGLGTNILVMEGMQLGNNFNIIDSSFVVRRDTAPQDFSQPNNILDIVQSPKTNIQNSTFDLDSISVAERDSFNQNQIAFIYSQGK